MKKITYFLILLLLLFNFFWIYKCSIFKDKISEITESYKQEIEHIEINKNNLEKLISNCYIRNIPKHDLENIFFYNDDVVVLLVSQGQCHSCIIEILIYLEQLGNKIGSDRILILGNFINNKDFEIFENDASPFIINVSKYFNKELPKEVIDHPTIFIMNRNFEIRYLFIPELYPELSETYFFKLLPDFFKN
ncbi:MAG TPA: hypothetical protein PLK12_07365 [Prolixibacteraceae bacterium]|nr:hypothetical protein [Prolixibacteraceae bacterium]